jgi:hypothetical protein
MTKHFCDDCGVELCASWWNGSKWNQADYDLCTQCYQWRCERDTRRVSRDRSEGATTDSGNMDYPPA